MSRDIDMMSLYGVSGEMIVSDLMPTSLNASVKLYELMITPMLPVIVVGRQ